MIAAQLKDSAGCAMTLEVFRSAGSEVCTIALRDKLLNE
jgi:hypothetical protein